MRALALAVVLAAAPAYAEDPDEAALALADRTQTETARAGDWRTLTEGALIETRLREGGRQRAQRLSLDTYYDTSIAPGWRGIFSDRLDLAWRGNPSYHDFINTLKEAYVSWQADADDIVDLGRVNLRNGVATGYNPTDYFRFGAVRSVVSIVPASLRENRLGSVIVRGQRLWNAGSLSALYSPKLADQPNASPFSPDFGSTNNQDRWLISLSHKLVDDFHPQWLLYGEEGDAPQFGVNLTHLLNDATVAYLEASAGRSPSLISQALARADDTRWRTRFATGATYTAPSKLSVTLEYDYNGAAPDTNDWNALRQGSADAYARYRSFAAALQDPATRRNAFLYARWQDALFVRFDLSAMQRYDIDDHSRISWFEARYRFDRVDVALQWQRNHGDAGSQFGALTQREVWQAVMTYFF